MTQEEKEAPVKNQDWTRWITVMVAMMTLMFGGMTWVVGQLVSKASTADLTEIRRAMDDRDQDNVRFLQALDQRMRAVEVNERWLMSSVNIIVQKVGGTVPPPPP